jgi:hypothetical protein
LTGEKALDMHHMLLALQLSTVGDHILHPEQKICFAEIISTGPRSNGDKGSAWHIMHGMVSVEGRSAALPSNFGIRAKPSM